MGKLLNDLSGKRFGRVTVIKRVENKNNRVAYLCKCDCGNEFITLSQHLVSGCTKSCGCLNREKASKRMAKMSKTHGFSHTRLYGIWKNMRGRCLREYSTAYNAYGGRGIKICKEWDDFQTFHDWACANGYSDELTIDRIDVNGDYCPENCRWIPFEQQANNKRTNHFIVHDGKRKSIAEWANELGFSYSKLKYRIRKGMDEKLIFSKRTFSKKVVLCVETGKIYPSVSVAGKETGVHPSGIATCCRGERKKAGGFSWKYCDIE